MKKQILIFSLMMLVVLSLLGGCKMVEKKDVASRSEQIEFLKKHESQMTEYIKSQNHKVESVQYDWDSIKEKNEENGTLSPRKFLEIYIKKINDREFKEWFSIYPKPDVNNLEKIEGFDIGKQYLDSVVNGESEK